MRRVIAMGETIMDILFQHNQPIAAVPGGSCFNSIISLGRTHTPSLFLGYTGSDHVGRQTIDFLHDNGVATDYFVMRQGEKSAISLAYLDQNGDADYMFYKVAPSMDGDAPMPTFTAGDVFLFGSFYASCDGTRQYVRRVLQQTKNAHSIVYYDLNFRKSHQHELEHLRPALIENFRHSDIVRGSADDFDVMYGLRDARTIYTQHIAHYCPLFICTSGAGSITVCTPRHTLQFDVPPVPTVSTVGAGDNFNAGFIYALIRQGITQQDLPTLDKAAWTGLVESGCAFAAQVCQSQHNSISKEFGEMVAGEKGM